MAQALPAIPGYQFPTFAAAPPSALQAALERVAAARAGAQQPAGLPPPPVPGGGSQSQLPPAPPVQALYGASTPAALPAAPQPSPSIIASAPTPMPRPQQRPPSVMTQTSVNPLPRGAPNVGGLMNMSGQGGLLSGGAPVTEVMGRMGQSGGGSDPFRKFAGSNVGQMVGDGLTSFGLGLMGGKDWQEGLAMGGQHFAETGQQRRTERKDAQTEGQVKTWLQANYPDLAGLPPELAMSIAQAHETEKARGTDPTSLMLNLAAAGLQPGTPEYQEAILAGISNGGTQINIPTGYRPTADGNFEFVPGGPADPATAAKTTEAQRRNQQLASVIQPEIETLFGADGSGGSYAALSDPVQQGFATEVPLLGRPGMAATSADFQQARNALSTIAQSYLYSVSGAAATDEEVRKIVDSVTPQPFENPDSVAQKQRRIMQMAQAVIDAGGGEAASAGEVMDLGNGITIRRLP